MPVVRGSSAWPM